ncbi:MAG: hypothetical protein HYT43_02430 [Candidatus Taylorbacteria bacterium]|nr:hypothetical protein [Candidatus Taylorbacteria bacterium]
MKTDSTGKFLSTTLKKIKNRIPNEILPQKFDMFFFSRNCRREFFRSEGAAEGGFKGRNPRGEHSVLSPAKMLRSFEAVEMIGSCNKIKTPINRRFNFVATPSVASSRRMPARRSHR